MRMKYLIVFVLTITIALLCGGACDHKYDRTSEHRRDAHEHEGAHEQADEDAHGHVGEHGHDAEGLKPIVVTSFTPKIELFMEYSPPVAQEPVKFLAHLTVLATGKPVCAGSLTLEAQSPNGERQRFTVDAPARDGLFIPEAVFGAAGQYRVRFILKSPQVEETIELATLMVYASDEAAEESEDQGDDEEAPDAISFLMEQQWKIGMRLDQAARRTLVHHIQVPGQISAPRGASAIVSPPIDGRLLRPTSSQLPQVGDYVEAGQILAFIEPPLPVTEATELIANQAGLQSLEIDLVLRKFEVETKGEEVERAIRQAQARLDFAQRAYDRAKQLRSKGAGTQQRYEEFEQKLKIAQAEYDTTKSIKQYYDAAKQEIESLQDGSRKFFTNNSTTLSLPIKAPISGQIVVADRIEGEQLQAHQELFRIVDLERVWITANVSEFDLGALPDKPRASVRLAAYPNRTFDVLGNDGRIVYIGKVLDTKTRTVPILYEMSNPDGIFRVGMFVDVFLETQSSQDAVAIPEEAIVMENGRPVAFVLLGGESFQKRELELGIRDNGFVEVKSGVADGERVVTKGAYVIKLASLAPESFGHGHGH